MEIKSDSELFPENLRNIENPPSKIYVRGNIELLKNNGIAIVGSRNCSKYGKEMTLKFAKGLSKYNLNIISGMAIGVDSYAHIGTIETGGNTIAVLPCGFENIYPEENKELFERIIQSEGLIVSEYPKKEVASQKNFLERNRIVSGLAIGTLVIEGAFRSGTSVTARITKQNGKPVFCIPSNLDNAKGYTPNYLIQKGASLVMSEKDIIKSFPQFALKKRKNSNKKQVKTDLIISSKENNVKIEVDARYLNCYKYVGDEATHINEIVIQSKLGIEEVNYELMMLELEGNIVALPGKYFKRS